MDRAYRSLILISFSLCINELADLAKELSRLFVISPLG